MFQAATRHIHVHVYTSKPLRTHICICMYMYILHTCTYQTLEHFGMHVYTYPIRAASDKNLCLSSVVAPLRNVCWKGHSNSIGTLYMYIVRTCTCSSYMYEELHCTCIPVGMCTYVWILMTSRKKGRQSNTTRHSISQRKKSCIWVETRTHNFTHFRPDDLPQNDAALHSVHMYYVQSGQTLIATGWGPVSGPNMSIAVPWNTSPNSPWPRNLAKIRYKYLHMHMHIFTSFYYMKLNMYMYVQL